MNVNISTFGWLLVIAAVVLLAIAFFAVVFEVDNAKVYPATLSLGALFGFLGLKIP